VDVSVVGERGDDTGGDVERAAAPTDAAA